MKDQVKAKIDQIADGFNLVTADDKRRLLEWVECPKLYPDGRTIERPLLIVGPKESGKTTLAMRLMKYFGEEPIMLAPQGNTLWHKSMSRAEEFYQAAETSKIVVTDGLPLVKTKDVCWLETFAPGIPHKVRKLRTCLVETRTGTAHMVVTALAMVKCVEKEILTPGLEKYITTVRLAERGARKSGKDTGGVR